MSVTTHDDGAWLEDSIYMRTILLTVTSIVIALSCSAPDPKEVKSETAAVVTDECAKLTLTTQAVETPGYNTSIKTILNASCAVSGCHVAGATAPDLTTYALAKDEMDASKTRMESSTSPMPPTGQLPAATLATFAAWVAAGGPETDVASTEETPPETEETPEPTPTPTTETPTETKSKCLVRNEKRKPLVEPDFEYLLKSTDVQACHDQKKIYDRNTKACGSASLDLSWCSRVGILEKFKTVNLDATPILDKALGDGTLTEGIGDGFIIDQCGVEQSGVPVAVFIRLVKPPEVPGLKVRVLTMDRSKKVAETTTTAE